MQGANLPRLDFSQNWNNKLLCDIFPTVRLENPSKYRVGQLYNCYLNKEYLGRVELLKINRVAFNNISEEMAFVDVGKPSLYLKTLLQKFYPKANFSTQKLSWIWFKHLDMQPARKQLIKAREEQLHLFYPTAQNA